MKRVAILSLALALLTVFDLRTSAQQSCTIFVNPDEASVRAAVNAAADGAVICLNAGSVTYFTGVDLSVAGTKAVEIRGAGSYVSPWGSAGQTVIRSNSQNGVFSGYETTGRSTIISNIRFTFDATSVTPNLAIITWNRQGGVSGSKPWIIHHNDFEITGRADAPRVMLTGALGGLIYRNRFTAERLPPNYVNTNIVPIWHGITDDGTWWGSASTMGTADATGINNLYVETNYFNGFNVATDRNTSSRMVWRFNEMHNASMSDHGYDSSTMGERHGEIYGNNFICDGTINLLSWIGQRGGTAMIFNNIFAALNPALCDFTGDGGPAIYLSQYKLVQCEEIAGWPGLYPDTYPVSHQIGWGWINGRNQSVGSSTRQNQPGGSGFQQTTEPIYIFNNTNNNTAHPLVDRAAGYAGGCRGMAYSSSGKETGTTLTASAYVSAGQHAFVAFADLVGGSAPTISDTLGNSWTPVQGGTNGSMRLSAWQGRITTGGNMTVVIRFDSSSAARAATLVTMRQLNSSPVDKNPAVVIDNASPYNGPSSGTLSRSDEVVLGYFALNGPTSQYGNGFVNDAITSTYPDLRTVSSGWSAGGIGINGTTGGIDTSNVAVAVTYRYVSATTAVQPQISNATASRSGIAGTISFENNGSNPDLQVTDFVQPNREYYVQAASFDGTSGTGSGPRASRPNTCTAGVAYWSTDQGEWDSTHAGNDGVLDKCIATNIWSNAWYTPYPYPHPLTTGGSPIVSGGTGTGGGDTAPPLPGNSGTIASSVTTTNATLNWTKATDDVSPQSALQYEVRLSTNNDISTLAAAETYGAVAAPYATDISSVTIPGWTPGSTYFFNVIVKDGAGNKSVYRMQSVTSSTPDTTAPSPGNSGLITSKASSTSASLIWTKATDNQSAASTLQYEVRQSTSGNVDSVAAAESNGLVVKQYTTDINSFVATGLSASTTYFFNVIVKDGAGNKAVYTMKSVTTSAPLDTLAPLPGNGGLITSTSTSNGATLNWTKASDDVSIQSALLYEVRRSNSANLDSVLAAESNGVIVKPYTTDISSFVATGLSPSTTYFFNVIVKDGAGNKAVYAMKGVTTSALLDTSAPAPGNAGLITSLATSNSATLSWTKANDDVSAQSTLLYEVRRSSSANLDSVLVAESNGVIVKPYTTDINSFVVTGLTGGTTYFFTVIVKDEAGNKAVYVMKSVTTSTVVDTTAPVPGNSGQITSNVNSNSITLTWAKANDNVSPQPALKYEIRISGSGNIGSVADAEGNGTVTKAYTADLATFTLSGLNSGTAYYFNVIVKDEAGNKAAYAMQSAQTTGRKVTQTNNGRRRNDPGTSPPEPDVIAPIPGAAGLITVSGVSSTGLTLIWTMATDNISPQTALQYEVRQSSLQNMNTVADAEANGTIIRTYTPSINSYVVNALSNPTQYYFTVIVRDEAGNKAIYATTGNVAVRYSFLANGGDSFNTTSLAGSSVSLNQVRVTPLQGTDVPSGLAIVRFSPAGKLISEGGFRVSGATRSGSVYVDITGATSTGDGTSTGIALSNPSNQDAEISYSFLDSTGTEVRSGLYMLPANNQLSAFLDQSPFNAPSSFRGTFTFSSSIPVNAAGMRGATNTSGLSLFSSLPIASAGITGESPLLPIFVDGGGWSTQVVLMNRSSAPQQGTVQFFGPEAVSAASPLEMTVNGVTSTTFSYAIPPNSVTRLVTGGASPLIAGGSVRVTPASSDTLSSAAAPEVLGILSLKRDGRTLSESTIQAVSTGTAFRAYVESMASPQSVNSSIAIVNAASVPNVVSYQFMNMDGTPVGSVASLTLPAGGQLSKFLRDLAPGLPENFQGLIRVTSTSPVAVAVFRCTYNSLGDFVYTPTPAVNEAAAQESAGLAFPMVATGGGYETQLMIFGPTGQAGSGDLLFISKDGVPKTSSSLGITP